MYKVTLKNGITVECGDAEEALKLGQSLDRTISVYPKTIDPMVQKEVTRDISRNIEKRVYNKKKGRKLPWTGKDIDVIANNLNLTCKQIAKLLPNRTEGAIYNVKWQLNTNKLEGARAKRYENYLLNK